LVLSGKVSGMLRSWIHAVDGRWIGVVDFGICDSKGAIVIHASGVPIPADAP
jgi:hypothetical protein